MTFAACVFFLLATLSVAGCVGRDFAQAAICAALALLWVAQCAWWYFRGHE